MKTIVIMTAAFACVIAAACGDDKLVVHEWGTFTSLQDENGKAIGGINTDDEPVPQFVHRLAFNLLLLSSEAPPHFFQGAPSCHPDVTMRLETPVIYFHPPTKWKPQRVDVEVEFRGGWLTEFYPGAEARAPGFDTDRPEKIYAPSSDLTPFWVGKFGHLNSQKNGELAWRNLIVGAEGAGPETSEKVWLAPRGAKSATVETAHGEREKFLFYRGVGNVSAPLRIARDDSQKSLEIFRQLPSGGFAGNASMSVDAAWLVQVRADGACAFRSLGKLAFDGKNLEAPFVTMPAFFSDVDFSDSAVTRLKNEMRAALVAQGLFADEANALLNTWQVSYFKSPGLRFFYLSPRFVIDAELPLKISVSCDVIRVMVGRIEIVTPEQRALLRKIAAGPAPDLSAMRGVTADSQSDFFKHPENVANWNNVMNGKAPISILGLTIPELYVDYLKLGRFRNALILDEQKRRPTPALGGFITKNGFEAYRVE